MSKDYISTTTYEVDIELGVLEKHLDSDFLEFLKKELHVDSLSHCYVRTNSILSDIVLFNVTGIL